MIIYNTCTTKAKENKVPLYELLVWITSLIMYKKMGYETKLYCSKDDIKFLKSHHLYNLYDYIDTELFDNCEKFTQVNFERFWSTRKIEAINKELQLNPTSIYSDTDVIMFRPIETPCDCLFWSDEPKGAVYIPWRMISTPENYEMKDYIKKTEDAYNCGVMLFKDYKLFKEFYDEYYKFVLGNPCELKQEDIQNNIFACNSEQRILKAVVNHNNASVDLICDWKLGGVCTNGIHLFIYKTIWKHLDMVSNPLEKLSVLNLLNQIADGCFSVIKSYDMNIYKYLKKFNYFKGKLTKYM